MPEPLKLDWDEFLGRLRALDPGASCGRAGDPADCPVARYARGRWGGHAFYYGHPFLLVYPPELRGGATYEARSRVVQVPEACQIFAARVDRAVQARGDVPARLALRIAETPWWRLALA